jgi:hypothetical protein
MYAIKIVDNPTSQTDAMLLLTLSTELNHRKFSRILYEGQLVVSSTGLDYGRLSSSMIEISNEYSAICYGLYIHSETKNRYEYRILFYQGKSLEERPTITYPIFHENTFLYNTSNKLPLTTL